MPSTLIKSCVKNILSYKDSSNNTNQFGFYARDAYDCLMLAWEFNSYITDNLHSLFIIQQKNWGKLSMNLKTSPFSILNKERREMDYIKAVYKRRVQSEIESYKDFEEEDNSDTTQAQDVNAL